MAVNKLDITMMEDVDDLVSGKDGMSGCHS